MLFHSRLAFAAIILLLFVFAIDCLTPRGLAVWSAYPLPVLMLSISISRRKALLWTTAAAAMLWIGSYFPPEEQAFLPWWVVVMNRTIMTGLFYSIYFIGQRKKQSEDAIREFTGQLDQRARELETANKELESFSYSVSHDLRAPLRAIDGFSRILIEEHAGSLNAEARRYLDVVRENTVRMGQLIDDLLAFSRLSRQAMKKRRFDISGVAKEVVSMMEPSAEERVVRIGVKPMPEARADPALVRHVLQNLVGNAIKYTRDREVAEIEIGSMSQDGHTVYYVKDNGVGFDMKYAPKVFGVFQRLHGSDYEGTGVGLAIAGRIIARHGGKIWAEAEVDKGATFYFTLGGAARKGGSR